MLICWDLQIQDVIFEGDCLQVIEIANRDKPPDTDLFSVIQDIQCLVKQATSWKIVFAYWAGSK